MMTGEFKITLDEKFRLMLPVQFRKELNEPSIYLMKGRNKCLWIFSIAKWEEKFGNAIAENTDLFSAMDLRNIRKYIGSSQLVEFDKAGRILIPETLRSYADITRDCVVSGLSEFCEIWDSKLHDEYIDEDDEDNKKEFDAASEEISQIIKRKKGII
ncbi:MAG: cell division/cell wall cluster transcriptional repressor MraZ [Treponema sp.]|nr:cell division/cell wall cluster transcriptional repressor MraZ [Treponema sp.]MCL2250985.1 cell division/cell wall cluster transcriptional repressor MraZ [Treponema sp.]